MHYPRMVRLFVFVCIAAACGGGKSTTGTVPASVLDGKGDNDPNPHTNVNTEERPAAQPAGSTEGGRSLSPSEGCARYAALKKERCEWANRFPPEMGSPDVCLATLENWFAPTTQDHETIEKTVACWALDCEAAATCMTRVQNAANPVGLSW